VILFYVVSAVDMIGIVTFSVASRWVVITNWTELTEPVSKICVFLDTRCETKSKSHTVL